MTQEEKVDEFLSKTHNNIIWKDSLVQLLKEERNAVLSEVEKEVENVIEQEAMWYNTNNHIPDSETNWKMIRKIVKDSLEEASGRMIKDISTIINNRRVK
mgnify:FL=1